jgi:hypothetical protein
MEIDIHCGIHTLPNRELQIFFSGSSSNKKVKIVSKFFVVSIFLNRFLAILTIFLFCFGNGKAFTSFAHHLGNIIVKNHSIFGFLALSHDNTKLMKNSFIKILKN